MHIARALLLLDAPLDRAWLAAAGLDDQMPRWRQLAASIRDRDALGGAATAPRRNVEPAAWRAASV